ncbi:hypothetical protein [Paractinoplanes rishiriensis]|uniref:Uncharacterized protein n=1 Tax=Paractinoplanes rishiriensis TaxID=1050105 RepID=A0A919MY14_9ACTN|nr:hypothetical protein [Actinoplanes rishiriensis]GIE99593.1 hypothetical protein Ari01nite_70580 [Actinoplanes rishiriensis]
MSEPSAPEESESEQSESAQPEEFLNRAARRAKGKKHAKAEVSAQTQPHGRNSVQARKNFGNRRTG